MKQSKIILSFALAVLLCAAAQSVAATVSIGVSEDAYVHSGNPSTNYGTSTLYVGDENWNDPVICCRSYLKFNLGSLPPGSTIVSAKIWLYIWGIGNPSSMDVSAHYVTDDTWTESAITWSSAPGFNPTATATTTVSNGAVKLWSWDVTADAQTAFGGDGVLSEVMRDTAEYTQGRWAGFVSQDEILGVPTPYLEVVYEEGTQGEMDFGDAPEGGIAYPSLGIQGQFPTCITVGPAGWIQHTNFGAWFGPSVDFESDGNAGLCPSGTCFPPYDQDECFQDGDAGLMIPDSFTIDNALNVVTCSAGGGTSLGQTCATAIWGANIDIFVTNNMPNNTTGYVNVLIDWDQNGAWGGTATGACSAPEYVLVDFAVPNGYTGPLSALMAAGTGFTIGPNSGYVWVRFSLTEVPLNNPNWDGSGSFEDGETEDYLLKVDPAPNPDLAIKFQQLPLNGLTLDQTTYWGHDELSTAYRNLDTPNIFEGCYMADDFADLKNSPVIKIKWWGSYIENEIMEPVNRFLIAFESDVPAVGQPGDVDYVASHPEQILLSQFVHRAAALPLNPGEFSETYLNAGGPPCNEALFEYEAVLENPFSQEPNTVYWLKIVALIDDTAVWARLMPAVQASGLTLCDFLNLPYSQQQTFGLQTPVTRWGWHNRDYTKMDPYASTPPAVNPGEHVAGVLNDGTEVWHFQDDAVSGQVIIDEATPEMPFVDQPTWQEEYYKYSLPYCQSAQQGVDGPDEIATFSKDLAFELWCAQTVTTYNLTTSSTYGGSVTTPGEGVFPYAAGTIVPLVATPVATPYPFFFWKWTGNTGTIANPNAASTTITMDGDKSITANFTLSCQEHNFTKLTGGTDNLVNVTDLNAFVTWVNANKTGTLFVVNGSNPAYNLLVPGKTYTYGTVYNITKKLGGTDTLVNVSDLNAFVTYVNNRKTGTLFVVNCGTCGC